MRRGWAKAFTALASVLCLGVAGCDGAGESGADQGTKNSTTAPDGAAYVSTAEVCGGALSPEAALALESITGAKEFEAVDGGLLARTAGSLRVAHDRAVRGHESDETLCSIRARNGARAGEGNLRFRLVTQSDLPGQDLASDERGYAVGRGALAGVMATTLYFECSSPMLHGSAKSPAYVRGEFSGLPLPGMDTPERRTDGLVVLHSASLALSKQLGCVKSGGLPERLSLPT